MFRYATVVLHNVACVNFMKTPRFSPRASRTLLDNCEVQRWCINYRIWEGIFLLLLNSCKLLIRLSTHCGAAVNRRGNVVYIINPRIFIRFVLLFQSLCSSQHYHSFIWTALYETSHYSGQATCHSIQRSAVSFSIVPP